MEKARRQNGDEKRNRLQRRINLLLKLLPPRNVLRVLKNLANPPRLRLHLTGQALPQQRQMPAVMLVIKAGITHKRGEVHYKIQS